MKVLLLVLAVLALLLWIPLRFCFEYKEKQPTLVLGWLFLKKKIPLEESQEKPEKETKKRTPSPQEKKEKKQGEKKSKPTLREMARTGFLLLKSSVDPVARLLRSIRLDKLVLYWAVTGEDAAEVALACGQRSAAAYTIYGLAQQLITVGPADLRFLPDYTGEEDRIYASGRVRVRPGMVLAMAVTAGGVFLWRLLGQQWAARKQSPKPQQPTPPPPGEKAGEAASARPA